MTSWWTDEAQRPGAALVAVHPSWCELPSYAWYGYLPRQRGPGSPP